MNIDVLIPVASESKYIRDAVRSAAQQLANKRVFILENNIGSEKYSKYLRELATEFSVEYVYFDVRLPMFENWQRCLDVGSFDWVAFLHDDDVWSRSYLETASQLEHAADIIFFEYIDFKDAPLPSLPINSRRKPIVTIMESREKLLAKMIDSIHHASSTLFKRGLNLQFPTANFRVAADQYAYRECIAVHKNIRALWIDTGCPNLIRIHPNQATWKGALLYAALENAISYRHFIAELSKEPINVDAFCGELVNRYTEVSLSRMLSAILFRKPYLLTTTIAARTLIGKRSFWLIIITLVRSFAQELVWTAKILVARYRSGV